MNTDDRTHDGSSAINDEPEKIIPGVSGIYDAEVFTGILNGGTFDTPLERGAGADAPQADLAEGMMGLMYTEQTFNELVAANTALIGENANLEVIVADLRERLDDFKRENAQHETAFNALLKRGKDTEERLAKAEKGLEEERTNHNYTKELLTTEKLRGERAKGYIDRFLDEEARLTEPVMGTQTNPAPRDPVGPDLGSIPIPVPRRSTHGDGMYFAPGEMASVHHSAEQRRRY